MVTNEPNRISNVKPAVPTTSNLEAASTLPMPERFDAYYTWLGVPPEEQPADYYRLLGLKRFEDNREVISNAADQRMAHIRSFQTGPHARESQKVLNELAKAAGCLLNPRRKAIYDQHLRSTVIAAKQEQALTPPSAVAGSSEFSIKIEPVKPISKGITKSTSNSRRTRTVLVWSTVAGVVLVTGAIATILALSSGGGLANNPGPMTVRPEAAAPSTATANLIPVPAVVSGEQGPEGPSPTQSTTVTPPTTAAVQKNTTEPTVVPMGSGPVEPPAVTPASIPSSTTAASSPEPTPAAKVEPARPITDSTSSSLASSGLPGKGKALRFESGNRIEITNSVGVVDLKNSFTVEMWVKFAPGNFAHWLCGDLVIGPNHLEVPSGTVAGWQLFIQQSTADSHRIAISTRSGYAQNFPAVENAWRHIAFCNDGKQVSVYVDGKRSATGAAETLLGKYTSSPLPLHIGTHGYMHASQPPGLTGDLTAFRVSSTVRYTAAFEPAANWERDSETQVLLDFANATDSKVPDLSGNGRDGVIHGARVIDLGEAVAVARTPETRSMPSTPSTPSVSTPASETETPPASETRTVPSEDQLVRARDQVRAVFRDELEAAKDPKDFVALADKLLALAAESSDDDASRYVMLEEAQKLAVRSGDLAKTLSVIDDWGRRFEIDVPELKSTAVSKVVEGAKTTVDRRRIAEAALEVADELIVAGRFDLAAEVAQTALAQASRAKEAELIKFAREVKQEITEAKKDLNEALAAEKQLEADPENAELNLKWGRFVCFHQRNWDVGLPFLAKGNHVLLASVAKLDMEQPTEPEKQAELARAWIEVIRDVTNGEKPAATFRAVEWARKAESQQKGLAKAELAKQIKELEKDLPTRLRNAVARVGSSAASSAFQPPREFIGMLGRIQTNGVDASVLWKYETGLRITNQSITDILIQAKAPRGKLHMEFAGLIYVPESTTINIAHSGGSSTGTLALYVNNKQLGEIGGTRATTDVYKVDLNAGEHRIRWVLMGEDLGNSSISITNAGNAQVISAYHSPAMLNAIRETPTRARLNVNMSR